MRKVLWLEDQIKELATYKSSLIRTGFRIDLAHSVTEAIRRMKEYDYDAFIFDINLPPGDSQVWDALDKEKRRKDPYSDSYLGFELLKSIFDSGAASIKIKLPFYIKAKNVIVLSVIHDLNEEIKLFGIPNEQILKKSLSIIDELPRLLSKIQERKSSR